MAIQTTEQYRSGDYKAILTTEDEGGLRIEVRSRTAPVVALEGQDALAFMELMTMLMGECESWVKNSDLKWTNLKSLTKSSRG